MVGAPGELEDLWKLVVEDSACNLAVLPQATTTGSSGIDLLRCQVKLLVACQYAHEACLCGLRRHQSHHHLSRIANGSSILHAAAPLGNAGRGHALPGGRDLHLHRSEASVYNKLQVEWLAQELVQQLQPLMPLQRLSMQMKTSLTTPLLQVHFSQSPIVSKLLVPDLIGRTAVTQSRKHHGGF